MLLPRPSLRPHPHPSWDSTGSPCNWLKLPPNRPNPAASQYLFLVLVGRLSHSSTSSLLGPKKASIAPNRRNGRRSLGVFFGFAIVAFGDHLFDSGAARTAKYLTTVQVTLGFCILPITYLKSQHYHRKDRSVTQVALLGLWDGMEMRNFSLGYSATSSGQ
ncbi:hypothetical protein K438DRAFT_1023456 [Mycena galopus ATCC 62051]|nr:hypothetical protein K438DRAFT_1023456 [Mycena galopus ATCC 62051]